MSKRAGGMGPLETEMRALLDPAMEEAKQKLERFRSRYECSHEWEIVVEGATGYIHGCPYCGVLRYVRPHGGNNDGGS